MKAGIRHVNQPVNIRVYLEIHFALRRKSKKLFQPLFSTSIIQKTIDLTLRKRREVDFVSALFENKACISQQSL